LRIGARLQPERAQPKARNRVEIRHLVRFVRSEHQPLIADPQTTPADLAVGAALHTTPEGRAYDIEYFLDRVETNAANQMYVRHETPLSDQT
jgi:hypothetical protein